MPESVDPNDPATPRPPWLALGVLFALSLAFLFLPVRDWMLALRAYISGLGWTGLAAYVGLYVVFAVGLIPSTIMGLLAGSVFGFALGVPLASLGSNLGALSAFLLSRTVLRGRVEEWARTKPKFSAIERAIENNAFKIVLLLRMSPFVPYTLLNYLLGVTRVPLWKYVSGNFLGMLPGNIGFVYIGFVYIDLAVASQTPETRALQMLGAIATIAAIVLITRAAQNELRKAALAPPPAVRPE